METTGKKPWILYLCFLETFLGGMETPGPAVSAPGRECLETFLGGMETSPSPGPNPPEPFLETFLGGMETGRRHSMGLIVDNLETFLGGMETGVAVEMADVLIRALKPSLVEWKHVGHDRLRVAVLLP